MIEIVIEGLNMKAVNSLILASAFIAKFGLFAVGFYALEIAYTFVKALLD